jgi:hypothetical protein
VDDVAKLDGPDDTARTGLILDEETWRKMLPVTPHLTQSANNLVYGGSFLRGQVTGQRNRVISSKISIADLKLSRIVLPVMYYCSNKSRRNWDSFRMYFA